MYKPDRAHYCRLLGRCVLKMDHFCPWLNNCIGFYNHKFFVLFIFYAAALCALLLVIMTPTFARLVGQIDDLSIDLKVEFRVSLTYLMVCLLTIGLFGFLGFHTYLLWLNYTTIEFLEKRGFNPPPGHINRFSRGICRNIQAVLGDNPLVWWLPVRWTCRGDGIAFEANPAFIGAMSKGR